MKKILNLFAFFAVSCGVFAQSTKVKMTLTYKGAPLCFWDVTLKHGDVELKKGKTDDQGKVDFGYVQLLSRSVDASGYKKTANGEKKWDVKGYMSVDDNGEVNFDFKPVVEESGMPGMVEAAWGLTLNDCAGSSSGGGSSSSSTPKTEETKEPSAVDKMMAEKEEENSNPADFGQGLQNSKTMQENKISNLNTKIDKKEFERSKVKEGTKEYSDLSYEMRQLEIERELTRVKLEKTNKMIEKGNVPLNKGEKEVFNQREEKLEAEADSLTAAQKAGNYYGMTGKTVAPAPKNESEPAGGNNPGGSENKEAEDEEEALTLYTPEQLAQMSTMGLKREKMEANTKIANRKVSLKTKSGLMKPEKIQRLEKEITQLEDQIKLMDAELGKRKEE